MHEMAPPVSLTGHTLSDAVLWVLVTAVGLFHMLDRMGFLPRKDEDDHSYMNKRVGKLHVRSLQSIIRHETRDMINPIILKMTDSADKQSVASERQSAELQQIRLVLTEIVTLQKSERN